MTTADHYSWQWAKTIATHNLTQAAIIRGKRLPGQPESLGKHLIRNITAGNAIRIIELAMTEIYDHIYPNTDENTLISRCTYESNRLQLESVPVAQFDNFSRGRLYWELKWSWNENRASHVGLPVPTGWRTGRRHLTLKCSRCFGCRLSLEKSASLTFLWHFPR